jgi:hypothetical protein
MFTYCSDEMLKLHDCLHESAKNIVEEPLFLVLVLRFVLFGALDDFKKVSCLK